MKNMRPAITNFPEVEVVVTNQQLMSQLNDIKGRIKVTLCNTLHNKNLSLTLRLAEAEEIKPILSRKELFDLIRKDNPAIEKLRLELDLHLF